MKRLDSYDVLNKEVFYRGMHILDYLYSDEKIELLDIEAVKATILSALVERNLIDPNREFLDLRTMSITESFYFGCEIYNPHPFVQCFPLWMKEELRKHSLNITGSIPVSVHASRPAGGAHFCIYDANTAFSVLFDEFTFINADYDSPTRPKERVTNRPFLEADVDGVTYLFDLLTKRMFKKNDFMLKYNMKIRESLVKSQFNEQQKELYQRDTKEVTNGYDSYLSVTMPFLESMREFPKMQEFVYEIEKSKEYYPEAFATLNHNKDIKQLVKKIEPEK